MPALSKTAARIIISLSIVGLLAVLLWLNSCHEEKAADTRATLATGQADAAHKSGADAVETIGNTMANETDIHATVKDGTDAINEAPAGNSNDAADRATCGLRSYRHTARCVALLGPVAE